MRVTFDQNCILIGLSDEHFSSAFVLNGLNCNGLIYTKLPDNLLSVDSLEEDNLKVELGKTNMTFGMDCYKENIKKLTKGITCSITEPIRHKKYYE